MTIADLKQHLVDLAKLLDSSGGKQVAKDVSAMAEALSPFGAQSPADFARYLALANEYHTTGKLSAPPKAPRKASKPKADPAEVAAAVRNLYDRSGDLAVTMEQIETELARLGELKKDGLLEVCDAMELAGMRAKTVGVIRDAIRQKILDRRSSSQRDQMIQTPPPGDVSSPGAADSVI